ncbi:MAG TPA: riboflavin biosynthesis protein RibD, partial [Pseudomonas sp.]|nr:riboflavin biosynthesis protein RibD [Pseudomonas sp.]
VRPLRVLVDGRLRVPLDAPFFQPGPSLVVTAVAGCEETYRRAGHEALVLGQERVDLAALLRELAARGANEVLVEAGPRLVGAFASLRLIDEYQIFMAAKFLGSSARPLLELPLERMSEARELKIVDIRAVGDDWKIVARPAS